MSERNTPIVSRRKFLTGLSATGLTLLSGSAFAKDRPMLETGRYTSCDNAGIPLSAQDGRIATPGDFNSAASCALSEETVEGPYFICGNKMVGRDIRGGVEGEPLTIALRVTDKSCQPVSGAIVDLWQCDARGNYSGHDVDPDIVARRSPPKKEGDQSGKPPARLMRGMRREPDTDERFLRGVLATDAEGIVEFDAIYPGFYAGRAIHTHYKVHMNNQPYLTSQALYPEEWNTKMMMKAPYNKDRKTIRVLNSEDHFSGPDRVFKMIEKDGRLLAVLNLTINH